MSTTEIKFFTYAEARKIGRTSSCSTCAYSVIEAGMLTACKHPVAVAKPGATCVDIGCAGGAFLEVPDGPSHAEPAQEAAGTQAPPDQLSAPQALENAAQHLRDRAETYDSPDGERSMGRAVAALNALLGRQALSESEGWMLLQLLKDARDRTGKPHRDSLEDGIAYAALKAEARLKEQA